MYCFMGYQKYKAGGMQLEGWRYWNIEQQIDAELLGDLENRHALMIITCHCKCPEIFEVK